MRTGYLNYLNFYSLIFKIPVIIIIVVVVAAVVIVVKIIFKRHFPYRAIMRIRGECLNHLDHGMDLLGNSCHHKSMAIIYSPNMC